MRPRRPPLRCLSLTLPPSAICPSPPLFIAAKGRRPRLLVAPSNKSRLSSHNHRTTIDRPPPPFYLFFFFFIRGDCDWGDDSVFMVLLALTRETPSFFVPSFWCLTANDDSRRTERRERGEKTKPMGPPPFESIPEAADKHHHLTSKRRSLPPYWRKAQPGRLYNLATPPPSHTHTPPRRNNTSTHAIQKKGEGGKRTSIGDAAVT